MSLAECVISLLSLRQLASRWSSALEWRGLDLVAEMTSLSACKTATTSRSTFILAKGVFAGVGTQLSFPMCTY